MQDRTKFISYLSPAKLNLGLKVVGKREDGYHLLNTVFCLIDLFDVIDIQIIDHNKISLINHQQAWFYGKDLAYRAASLLSELTGCKLGANIKIQKAIPSGAGLGGGSSNAATTLIALNHLWQLNLSQQELIDIGSQLGADVPFFIYGQNAYATGIGDIFSPIELEERYFVLVKPSFHIPTKDIFENLNYQGSAKNEYSAEYLINNLENDLQSIAECVFPELKKIIDFLKDFGNPIMTGSGSVIFLEFFDKNIAKKVANEIAPCYNTYLVKKLDKSPTQY